jgi:hypothetical protein
MGEMEAAVPRPDDHRIDLAQQPVRRGRDLGHAIARREVPRPA